MPHEVKLRAAQGQHGPYLTIDETIRTSWKGNWPGPCSSISRSRPLIIAADPKTGAILAAASSPTLTRCIMQTLIRNVDLAPVTHSFEPGSTFKLTTRPPR